MAFSMFLRNRACTSYVFNQQIMRFATQSVLKQNTVASTLPIKSLALTQSNSTPILNSVRSFRTSMVRLSDAKAHDHSKLWVVEKLTSAALVPLVPLGLLMPNRVFDSVLAILITAHSFWGLEAMVVEYLRVLVVGSMVPKVAMGVVYLLTAVMLGGLFYLIFNDIGICRAFWRIWRNMKKPKDSAPPTPPPAVQDEVYKYFHRFALWNTEGLEAIVVDYVRASIFGPVIPKIAIGLVYLISIATLGGLFYLISHDIGIANSFRQLWAIKSDSNKA